MEMNKITKKICEIEMSKEMRERIIGNCKKQMEEERMSRTQKNKKPMFQRPLTVVASVALCVCVVGVTALAASEKLQGFFKDVKRWDGAVTGTTYENATEEIKVEVAVEGEIIEVYVEAQDSTKAPYGFFEILEIGVYEIVDDQGNAVDVSAEPALWDAGNATIEIPAESLPNGRYTLIISEFVGSVKADQPLPIRGNWVCEFEK